MKIQNRNMVAAFLFLSLTVPAFACDGCGGRFPPGVNIRLLRLRMQTDASSFPGVAPPPPSKGEAIPAFVPQQSSKKKAEGKSKPEDKKPVNNQKKR